MAMDAYGRCMDCGCHITSTGGWCYNVNCPPKRPVATGLPVAVTLDPAPLLALLAEWQQRARSVRGETDIGRCASALRAALVDAGFEVPK